MSYLDRLIEGTRERVAAGKMARSAAALEEEARASDPPRGFRDALTSTDIAVIAEIKRTSPSKGALAVDLDPGGLASAYAQGGASAISVLTEPRLFRGSLEDLRAAREHGLPVLRKDFIVDAWQVAESRAASADALLLIVRALDDGSLADLLAQTVAFGMDALVEVHDEEELERALKLDAELIGVNHRDLGTFEVDDERTIKLAPLVPPDRTLVALSGVSSRADVERLEHAGAAAVLVGESLVTSDDPVAQLRRLRGVV